MQPLPLFGRAAIIFEYENSQLLQEVMAALDEVSARAAGRWVVHTLSCLLM